MIAKLIGFILSLFRRREIVSDGQRVELQDRINFVTGHKTYNSYRKGHN